MYLCSWPQLGALFDLEMIINKDRENVENKSINIFNHLEPEAHHREGQLCNLHCSGSSAKLEEMVGELELGGI